MSHTVEMITLRAELFQQLHQQIQNIETRHQQQIIQIGQNCQQKIEAMEKRYDDKFNEQQEKIEKLEAENHSLFKKVTLFEKQILKNSTEKLNGKWQYMKEENWDQYKGQFGRGFLFWMTFYVAQPIEFESDGANCKLINREESDLSHRFVLGEGFEWENDGHKHKVLFNFDFEEGKLVGKETRLSDGKISKDEIFVEADGNLVFSMETGDVKALVKYHKV